jgi:MFS family permease
MAGAGVFGLGCTLAALAPGYWWFAATLMIIVAAGMTFSNGTNSIMQISTEPAMRGRVMALRVAIALGGTPIGAPIVGWLPTTSALAGRSVLALRRASPLPWR